MANINSLGMGETLSNDARINVKKSLFGSKVLYSPTGSKVKVFKTSCSPEMGSQLKQLFTGNGDNLAETVSRLGKFVETEFGNFQLQGCVSADHAFVALQLYQFGTLNYDPVSQVKIFEGAEAQTVASLF